jgi:hypothetical protein
MVVPAVVIAAGVVIVARSMMRGAPRLPQVPWIVLAALAAVYAGIVVFVIPALERQKVVPDVARWVAAHAAPDARVCTFQLSRWSTAFRFYVDRHVVMIDDPGQLDAFVNADRPFYCAMLAPGYDDLIRRGAPVEQVYARDGMWVTSGRVLWRQSVPPARFVVVTRARDAQERREGREE